MKKNRSVVALSGGFDPPNAGHASMILDASKIGDVVIILNSDKWCARHRWNKKNFIDWEKRREILMEIPGVIDVIRVNDNDNTVCEALERLKPDFFGNGGNRTVENTPEVKLCKQLHVGTIWFLGNVVTEDAKQVINDAVKKAHGIC
jgi:D-beta-D-heptose 7-phosphate kinase/D-beta-D-heptose 1-phosphate adenosyltransferase